LQPARNKVIRQSRGARVQHCSPEAVCGAHVVKVRVQATLLGTVRLWCYSSTRYTAIRSLRAYQLSGKLKLAGLAGSYCAGCNSLHLRECTRRAPAILCEDVVHCRDCRVCNSCACFCLPASRARVQMSQCSAFTRSATSAISDRERNVRFICVALIQRKGRFLGGQQGRVRASAALP
jgi:hypothetical protein